MATHAKHYYLFSIRVWSVVMDVEGETQELELEEEDSDSGSAPLTVQATLSAGDIPLFGFVNNNPYYGEEE